MVYDVTLPKKCVSGPGRGRFKRWPAGPWPVKIKEGQSVSPMTGPSGQMIPGVIYPDCACDFHFLALIKNQLKVAGIIAILGQIVLTAVTPERRVSKTGEHNFAIRGVKVTPRVDASCD